MRLSPESPNGGAISLNLHLRKSQEAAVMGGEEGFGAIWRVKPSILLHSPGYATSFCMTVYGCLWLFRAGDPCDDGMSSWRRCFFVGSSGRAPSLLKGSCPYMKSAMRTIISVEMRPGPDVSSQVTAAFSSVAVTRGLLMMPSSEFATGPDCSVSGEDPIPM